MLLMVAFGVMNVAAMVALALVIAIEKHWRHGRRFAGAVGVIAIVWAMLILVEPGAAPGLYPHDVMDMGSIDGQSSGATVWSHDN
jgi:predicted metal-binding membrane protein